VSNAREDVGYTSHIRSTSSQRHVVGETNNIMFECAMKGRRREFNMSHTHTTHTTRTHLADVAAAGDFECDVDLRSHRMVNDRHGKRGHRHRPRRTASHRGHLTQKSQQKNTLTLEIVIIQMGH
jgi:hypothetical protein